MILACGGASGGRRRATELLASGRKKTETERPKGYGPGWAALGPRVGFLLAPEREKERWARPSS
jgi:hypothetical protein